MLRWRLYDDTVGLETFMQRASCISQRLNACFDDEDAHQLASPATGPPVPEPMQVDVTRLSRTEHAHLIAYGLCLYCASPDHTFRNCPVRPPRPAVSTIQLKPDITLLSLLPVQLLISSSSLSISTLLDSELHLTSPPKQSQTTQEAAARGAPSRNNSGKAAGLW